MRLGTITLWAALMATAAQPSHGQGSPATVNTADAAQNFAAESKEIDRRPSTSGGAAWRPTRQQARLLLSSNISVTATELFPKQCCLRLHASALMVVLARRLLSFSVAPL
jgi:LmbE family N-acetylglucosaminyl deacetylase